MGHSGVFAAFVRLAGDDRDVIGLRIVAGFTPVQASAGLGVSTDAVEARLAAALGRLRATAPGIGDSALLAALRGLA